MKTITVKTRQTLYDIALEQYGSCEAVTEILELNTEIANDPAALVQRGIDAIDGAFYLDVAVAPGTRLVVDDNSKRVRKNMLREITTDITTYRYGTDDQ